MNPRSNKANQVYGKILGLFPGLKVSTKVFLTRAGQLYPPGTAGVILEISSFRYFDERLIKMLLDKENQVIIYVWETDLGIV